MKPKPPGATGDGSSVSAEVAGLGPAPVKPPACSSYICIFAQQRELNVSGASTRRQPEGTRGDPGFAGQQQALWAL